MKLRQARKIVKQTAYIGKGVSPDGRRVTPRDLYFRAWIRERQAYRRANPDWLAEQDRVLAEAFPLIEEPSP